MSGEIYDNHLIVSLENEKEQHCIAVDLKTMEVIENKLTIQDEDGSVFSVPIMDETADYFLVLCGFEYVPTVQYGGGNEYAFDEYVEVFKLIKKADYWKSEPKYIDMKDNVFKS